MIWTRPLTSLNTMFQPNECTKTIKLLRLFGQENARVKPPLHVSIVQPGKKYRCIGAKISTLTTVQLPWLSVLE